MKKRDVILNAVKVVPSVRAHLSNKARWLLYTPVPYKSAGYMLQQIERLMQSLYDNQIGGQFIDLMANLISGQLMDAYQTAWRDEGFAGELPDYLMAAYSEDVLRQYDFVDQFFKDIIDARIDGKPIDPLMARAQLWGNQWENSYQRAVRLMAEQNGGKMIWLESDTVDKCDTCLFLDGKVMYASEWAGLGLHPGDGPNDRIDCNGWNCHCQLVPTDERRTPNAYGRIEEMLFARA